MKVEVQIWINNGQKFNDAVALLKQFGVKIPKAVERIATRDVANAWASDWVYQALTALTDDQKPIYGPKMMVSDGVDGVNDGVKSAKRTIEKAQNVTAFTEEQKKLQQQQSLAHSELRAATTDEDRLKAATEIMEVIIPAKEAAYAAAQQELQQDAAPEAEAATTTLSANDIMKRNSLRVQISKTKGKIKGSKSAAKKAVLETKLFEMQNELKKYEQ